MKPDPNPRIAGFAPTPDLLMSAATADIPPVVQRWLDSDGRAQMILSREYYAGRQEIMTKERVYFAEDGSRNEMKNVHNIKLVYNLFRKLVKQKVGSILLRKFEFSSQEEDNIDWNDPESLEKSSVAENISDSLDIEAKETDEESDRETEDVNTQNDFIKLLNRLFDDKFRVDMTDGLIDCILDGEVWLYAYIKEDGNFGVRWMPAMNIFPVYIDELDDTVSDIYHFVDVQEETEQQPTYIMEHYTVDGRRVINTQPTKRPFDNQFGSTNTLGGLYADAGLDGDVYGSGAGSDKSDPYITVMRKVVKKGGTVEQQEMPATWDEMPFFRVKIDKYPLPYVELVKSLCDTINTLYSNMSDQIADNPDGKILKIINAGAGIGHAIQLRIKAAVYRVIPMLATREDPSTDADFMADPIPLDSYKESLIVIRKALFETGGAFDDSNTDMFGANVSEELLNTAKMTLIRDEDIWVTHIEEALNRMVRTCYIPYLIMKGFDDYSDCNVRIKLAKPVNELSLIQEIVSMGGRVSNQTMLGWIPKIVDVAEELERIKEEDQMQMDIQTAQTEEAAKIADKYAPEPAAGGFGAKKTVNTGSPNGGGKPQDAARSKKAAAKGKGKTFPNR
jgi:SPP1 family phage portal protein